MVQKSKFLKMKNSSNQFIQRPYKTRLLPSLPSSISVTQYKAKNSSEMFLKSQQNFREIVNFSKKTDVEPKTKLFSCLSCQTKFGSIFNLIQHVVCNVFGVWKLILRKKIEIVFIFFTGQKPKAKLQNCLCWS